MGVVFRLNDIIVLKKKLKRLIYGSTNRTTYQRLKRLKNGARHLIR